MTRRFDALDAARVTDLELDTDIIARLNEIFNLNRGRPLVNNAESPEAFAW